MKHTQYLILNTTNNKIIAKELRLANCFLLRLKGLIFTDKLKYSEGLLISPCQQIHTHFMKYPIDIVFMDDDFKVLHIIKQLHPWRFSKFYKHAYYVLELPPNAAAFINIDDVLALSEMPLTFDIAS